MLHARDKQIRRWAALSEHQHARVRLCMQRIDALILCVWPDHACLSLGQEACSVHKQAVMLRTPGSPRSSRQTPLHTCGEACGSPRSRTAGCPAVLPSARSSRHSRHLPCCFPCPHLPRSPPPPPLSPPPLAASAPLPPAPAPRAPARTTLSLGPAAAGATECTETAPVKRAAVGCAHCGHLAAGALGAAEGGRAADGLAAHGAGESAVGQRGAAGGGRRRRGHGVVRLGH
jgi:hypothetical protein